MNFTRGHDAKPRKNRVQKACKENCVKSSSKSWAKAYFQSLALIINFHTPWSFFSLSTQGNLLKMMHLHFLTICMESTDATKPLLVWKSVKSSVFLYPRWNGMTSVVSLWRNIIVVHWTTPNRGFITWLYYDLSEI